MKISKTEDLINLLTPENKQLLYSHNSCLYTETYDNSVYLAWRTAPKHYPNKKARIIIAKSNDGVKFKILRIIEHNAEVREPIIFLHQNALKIMYFIGSKKNLVYRPLEVRCEDLLTGENSIKLFEKGTVPWRIRTHNDTHFLSTYNAYSSKRRKMQPDAMISTCEDLVNWIALPGLTFQEANSCEIEFIILGNILIAIIRSESDHSRIIKYDLGKKEIIKEAKLSYKLDSALLFEWKGELFCVARDNYDKPFVKSKSKLLNSLGGFFTYNMLRYWNEPKRTMVYSVNTDELSLTPVLALPSRGDTAFPAFIKFKNGAFLYNYPNEDSFSDTISWRKGQNKPTRIYIHHLS